ncbi:MAG: hypothetical protein JXB45_08430 [Candidatus Krumholzibacteriota bacterium]|nr:hypothetical protein [Candidatus Krumholzibacteriota bacterium]
MKMIRCFSLLLIITLGFGSLVSTGVPRLINYQGTITGSEGPLNGDYDLTFRIYADSTGVPALWTEAHQNVPVSFGLFNVILGRYAGLPDILFEANERWLAIRVGEDPEMEPRMRITAVPRTMRAAIAESSLVSVPDGDWAFNGGDIYRLAGGPGSLRVPSRTGTGYSLAVTSIPGAGSVSTRNRAAAIA